MSRRGPKPVDIDLLKTYAETWGRELFLLRDGVPGGLYRMRPGKTKPLLVANVLPASEAVRSTVLPRLEELRGKQGILYLQSPVFAEPEIWNHLKCARSPGDIRRFVSSMARHMVRMLPPTRKSRKDVDHFLYGRPARKMWSELLGAAREGASELLRARDLPHYPGSDKRKSSDDKRIEFFAKVLAGLALGLAPATATKRLSHWKPSRPSETHRIGLLLAFAKGVIKL